MDLDGADRWQHPRRLVRGKRPHWTPDSRRIVFQRIGLYGQANSIASMRPDGTGFWRVLVSAGGDHVLDLSPDGRRVLWHGLIRREEEWRPGLYTSSIRRGGIRLVHRESGPYRYDASWSPDGGEIVFALFSPFRDPSHATWIVSSTGGRPRKLLARPYEGLAWQPLPRPGTRGR